MNTPVKTTKKAAGALAAAEHGKNIEHHAQQLYMTAIEKGATPEQLQQMMDLQERWEKREAEKAFNRAMAAFHADPPNITKNKHVFYKSKNNYPPTDYWHATLDHCCEEISKAMAPHGLSFRWNLETVNSQLIVTCIIMHVDGHSERVSVPAPADGSGGKNGIQAVGSAITYMKRYTLLAATGVAESGAEDDDGMAAGAVQHQPNAAAQNAQPNSHGGPNPQQMKALQDLSEKAGMTESQVMQLAGKSRFTEMDQAQAGRCINHLNSIIKEKGASHASQ